MPLSRYRTTKHCVRWRPTWSQSQPEPTRPTPRLGEHSREVLREAGYSDAEIARMLSEKVTLEPGDTV